MQAFHTTSFAQEIFFASDALARLGEAVARSGWQRILLCTSPSQDAAGHVATISSSLGSRLVTLYPQVQSHVLQTQVSEVVALAYQYDVDAVIGLGGGSPIGMAKAVCHAREQQHAGQSTSAASPTSLAHTIVIAIPTTYAGSEITPVYGVTSTAEGVRRKITVSDPRVVPRLILYDPLLTLHLPRTLTASSGVNALAHCFEALYSITRNPLSTAAALGAIRFMWQALPRCVADGMEHEARSEMLMGAYLAGHALSTVTMALHHGLCHVLGGSAGIAHGTANAIILPHALRFNLTATATAMAQAAEPMGIVRGKQSDIVLAERIVQRVSDLIQQMGLPQRLREVGVSERDLPHLAQLAFESRTVQSNPKPITDVDQMLILLRQAW